MCATKEDAFMTTTTVTNFRKNIYSMVENTIRYNEPVNITTKESIFNID